MAKAKSTFRMEAFDGDFRFKDRVPDASQGHRICADHLTREAALTSARAWMQAHPPQGEGAHCTIREETRRTGDSYRIARWESTKPRYSGGEWTEK